MKVYVCNSVVGWCQ